MKERNLDAEMRSYFDRKLMTGCIGGVFSGTLTSSEADPEEPLTLKNLTDLMESLPPPPPQIKFSRHAKALPTGKPRSDYMREMVARVGQQANPAIFCFKDGHSETYVLHTSFEDRLATPAQIGDE